MLGTQEDNVIQKKWIQSESSWAENGSDREGPVSQWRSCPPRQEAGSAPQLFLSLPLTMSRHRLGAPPQGSGYCGRFPKSPAIGAVTGCTRVGPNAGAPSVELGDLSSTLFVVFRDRNRARQRPCPSPGLYGIRSRRMVAKQGPPRAAS